MNATLAHELVPIQSLRRGQTAEVIEVLGKADAVHRLQELGIQNGTGIEMVQPGSPCIVKVTGQTLCFRAAELLRVLVRPVVLSR